ncbi:hypothetical protein [Natrinema caseinilyticum]|uniref:hypothetical protein n=1 Tax=Natrinema caseinilyticum TaxID=2961570 RepID=UPI0020C42F54|nr:hypothetical protein [Natrinema caseinilyticum]
MANEVGIHTPETAATEKQAVADAVIEERESVEKTTVYQKAAEELLPEEDHHRTEARLITILSYEIDEAESTPTESKYKAEIDTLLSGVSFRPLDKRAQIILSVYQSFRQESWKEHDPGEVFDQIRDPNDALVREFMRKYTDRTIYQYLTSNEAQAREFRDTLADLIRLGRVDIGSLTQDVIQEKVDKVKQELREANDRYSSYLVLSMKLMTAEDKHGVVDEFESNFPLTIRWKGRSVAGEGYPSPKFLSMRATYANQTYESAADFLEEEIKPLLPPQDEWEDGSFVAVMPFEAPSYEAFPKKETVIEESSD